MQNRLLTVVEETSMKTAVPKFEIGDTVDVHVRILEGDKERIQIYNGVERKFPIHSPRIADVVVKRSGKVRRAKLYYLRNRSGKAVRLKERFSSGAAATQAKAAKAERKAVKVATKKAKAEAAAAAKSKA